MFSSYFFRPHSWLLVEGKRYGISTTRTTQMSIQLNTLENLNEKTITGFFINRDNLNYHSIKTLRTTFANLPYSALPFISLTSALNIGLIRSVQSEAAQTTVNDVKDCINESVNEVEAKRALALHGQRNSKIYEEYRLTSELPDELTLNVLEEKFIAKMGNRGFIWTSVELRDGFKYLIQLYLRVLKWTSMIFKENTVI